MSLPKDPNDGKLGSSHPTVTISGSSKAFRLAQFPQFSAGKKLVDALDTASYLGYGFSPTTFVVGTSPPP
jgi:hypothetical protein